eukprot:TRINITY_DN40047_c0_g1_i1.p1 TRINITY_DN40047_c0_g1~~TRINITY_DN40047_c0_g1_i1.p1  ORF type:complete len:172 (-),score=29.55 TRINITY_DN40047_c0_g1_i1:168-683(-)
MREVMREVDGTMQTPKESMTLDKFLAAMDAPKVLQPDQAAPEVEKPYWTTGTPAQVEKGSLRVEKSSTSSGAPISADDFSGATVGTVSRGSQAGAPSIYMVDSRNSMFESMNPAYIQAVEQQLHVLFNGTDTCTDIEGVMKSLGDVYPDELSDWSRPLATNSHQTGTVLSL